MVAVIAGAANCAHAVFDNLNALFALVPQPEYALTLILSVPNAEPDASGAAFDVYITLITLSLDISPESTTAPEAIPPIEVGKVHA